ncbi:MAG: VCBS repeat-containing protein [Granulosicoccus sp.]|nr:VCBS repeat-containing protein [Granulosicoccus sp.]
MFLPFSAAHRAHRPKFITVLLSSVLSVVCYPSASASGDETIIPHGEVARATGTGITQAWFSCPTTRYRHAVLGDNIEGGCLSVRDESDTVFHLELDEHLVFEDVTPRIADMNGDGVNDVIAVRSDVNLGAALTIYTIADNRLLELAATPAIGQSFRWLAPAGIADFDLDGQNDIAYVETPHLGGLLRYWTLKKGKLEELASLRGFSNHSIGSSRVSLSRVLDYNDDDKPDLALPSFSGDVINIVTLDNKLSVIDTLPFDLSFFD